MHRPSLRTAMLCAAAAVITVTMSSCSGGTTDPDPGNNPGNNPGNGIKNVVGTTNRAVTVQGLSRQFVVHVGATVGANTAVPVVFMLHGTSGDGPQFFNISGWRERADADGFIAVFPTALVHCFHEDENNDGDFTDGDELHVNTKWAHGELGSSAKMPLCTTQELAALNATNRAAADHPLADDLAFFDAMLTFLKANYLVDSKAIYVSGFSNGAQMANRLGMERSNVIAAVEAHAGGVSVSTVASRAISATSSVGTNDDRYMPIVGASPIPLGEGTLVAYPKLYAIMVQPMLNQLQLTTAYTYDSPTVNGKRTSRWTFRTSTVGANNSFSFTLLEDNTHAYPNGSNYPMTMANVVWPIFKAVRLP